MSLIPTITITGGFSIVPKSGGGVGYWNLITGGAGYIPAWSSGDLTWPDHSINEGLADPNSILTSQGTIYINYYDSAATDQQALLSSLINNNGTITFTQGGNNITFAYTTNTFSDSGYGSVCYDPYYNGANGLSVVSTSNSAFTDGEVQITINVTTAPTAHVYLPQAGLLWTSYGDDGNGHTFLQIGQPADGSGYSTPPQAGWKFLDDTGTICTLRNDAVWFSGGAPTPITNGGGWLCVVDRIAVFNDANPEITLFENTPSSFTINSSDLDGLASIDGQHTTNGTIGFSVTASENYIYGGVYGTLNTYSEIETAFNNAGITDTNGYIANVVWGSGSSIGSGLAKISFDSTNKQVVIESVDPTDSRFLTSDINSNNGTSFVGTFNFPAKFTLLEPIDNKGGWC